jgi:hypothetical protein
MTFPQRFSTLWLDVTEPILVTQQGVDGKVDLHSFLNGWIDNKEDAKFIL